MALPGRAYGSGGDCDGGAGLGLVLILRWYWWRINAWTEITATLAPFIGYAFAHLGLDWVFPNSFFFTVAFTTISWIVVMYATEPEPQSTLVAFYSKIRPGGSWKPVQWKVPASEDIKPGPHSVVLFIYWILGIAAVYGALFLVGSIILH